jgi:hypothetical protein
VAKYSGIIKLFVDRGLRPAGGCLCHFFYNPPGPGFLTNRFGYALLAQVVNPAPPEPVGGRDAGAALDSRPAMGNPSVPG